MVVKWMGGKQQHEPSQMEQLLRSDVTNPGYSALSESLRREMS